MQCIRSVTITAVVVHTTNTQVRKRASGGVSYGVKGLKPPRFCPSPPPDFCVKWDFHQWQLSLSAITEGLYLTVKCKKTRLAAGLRPDPLGELTALPRPRSWIWSPTSKGREGKEGEEEREGGKGERREREGREERGGEKEGRGKGEWKRDLAPRNKILAPPLKRVFAVIGPDICTKHYSPAICTTYCHARILNSLCAVNHPVSTSVLQTCTNRFNHILYSHRRW